MTIICNPTSPTPTYPFSAYFYTSIRRFLICAPLPAPPSPQTIRLGLSFALNREHHIFTTSKRIWSPLVRPRTRKASSRRTAAAFLPLTILQGRSRPLHQARCSSQCRSRAAFTEACRNPPLECAYLAGTVNRAHRRNLVNANLMVAAMFPRVYCITPFDAGCPTIM